MSSNSGFDRKKQHLLLTYCCICGNYVSEYEEMLLITQKYELFSFVLISYQEIRYSVSLNWITHSLPFVFAFLQCLQVFSLDFHGKRFLLIQLSHVCDFWVVNKALFSTYTDVYVISLLWIKVFYAYKISGKETYLY